MHRMLHGKKRRRGRWNAWGWGMRAEQGRCLGKTCYSKKDAATAKNLLERSGSPALRIYPCGWCGSWHLTHKGAER